MVTATPAVIAPLLLALAVGRLGRRRAPLDLKQALKDLLDNALEVQSPRGSSPRAAAGLERGEHEAHHPRQARQGRIEGDNVRIYLICTPYVEDNGEVLLLSQGQVWLTEPPENEAKYFNTFSSIPVSFGEKVLYFPLGSRDSLR